MKQLGYVPQERVIDLMAKVDIGITTHQSGAFGELYFSTKIIEFMTQGLPVISSRTRTLEKYIPEDAIFYFKAEQVEDLVQKIVFMYKNPDIVLEKLMNAKKLSSKYTWHEDKKNFLSFYEGLIK